MVSRPDSPRSSRTHSSSRLLALVLLGVTACVALMVSAERASSDAHSMHMANGTATTPMTDESMTRWVRDWYLVHPMHGQNASAAAADTFKVRNFQFDTDGNLSTQVDTAKIQTGQTILWILVTGAHTTTNGSDSSDPQAGVLWDQPMTTTGAQFSFTFTSPGTYPFFCRPHEGLEMKGVVVVSDPASVPPPTGTRLAFVADPSPNPTGSGMRFQFSMARSGRVRAQLFDLSGHLIARILDRDLDPGVHAAGWDGRTLSGSSAAPGMYYLSLSANGTRLTRQVSVVR